MSAIDDLLEPIRIPKLYEVRQHFDPRKVETVEGEIRKTLRETGVLNLLEEGQSVALAVGSRGVAELPLIVKTVVSELVTIGTKPFIVPAMGSHGGATIEGQIEILEGMGVTEEYTGAPIRATMETVELGTSDSGLPVLIDKYAHEADATILINRIHPHVSFRGDYESGLMKMVAIGLGKLRGANICHDLGFGVMHKNIPEIGNVGLEKGNIKFGLAVIENGYHEIFRIEAVKNEDIAAEEPKLLELAKQLEPCIYFDQIDVLIMDEIGKNISGSGFDTNIIGRYGTPYAKGGPHITKMSILDVTDVSHGNCLGIGMAEFTTRRIFDKFSFENTYPNSLTATVQTGVKIPMVLKNDKQAVQAAIKTCNIPDKENVRLVWLKNTLEIDKIWISEPMVEEARRNSNLDILGDPHEVLFDDEGNTTKR